MLDKVLFYFLRQYRRGERRAHGDAAKRSARPIFLITTLLATAGIFLQFAREFLFYRQIILYVGGIMVLFVFVIMLVNLTSRSSKSSSRGKSGWHSSWRWHWLAGRPHVLVFREMPGQGLRC